MQIHVGSRDRQRVMVFVDASNLMGKLSTVLEVRFRADNPPRSAIDLASLLIDSCLTGNTAKMNLIRKFWFGSFQGSDSDFNEYRSYLKKTRGFHPIVLKKPGNQRAEKGVDMALAIEMLTNASNHNFDIGILVAGDGDYVQLVREVQRYGQIVWGAFFDGCGLSDELRSVSDDFRCLTVQSRMAQIISKVKEEVGKSPRHAGKPPSDHVILQRIEECLTSREQDLTEREKRIRVLIRDGQCRSPVAS